MATAIDEVPIRALYQELLDAWNKRSPRTMAQLFVSDAIVIGFDGSEMEGAAAIETAMSQIFDDHLPARYVGLVRRVSGLSADVAVLHAVAGMVPPGQRDLKEENNAVQIMTAVKREGRWRIAVYQNTPAAYHGRPQDAKALSEELRRVLRIRASDIFEPAPN